jgi:hypothetical protein
VMVIGQRGGAKGGVFSFLGYPSIRLPKFRQSSAKTSTANLLSETSRSLLSLANRGGNCRAGGNY